MLQVFTSYVANYRKFGDCTPVCIMRWKPKFYNGAYYQKLSPSAEYLSALKYDNMQFGVFYNNMLSYLNILDPQEVLDELEVFGDKIVLLCTCKDYFHCHRKIVADWLVGNLGIIVKEIGME